MAWMGRTQSEPRKKEKQGLGSMGSRIGMGSKCVIARSYDMAIFLDSRSIDVFQRLVS